MEWIGSEWREEETRRKVRKLVMKGEERKIRFRKRGERGHGLV